MRRSEKYENRFFRDDVTHDGQEDDAEGAEMRLVRAQSGVLSFFLNNHTCFNYLSNTWNIADLYAR